MAKKKLKKNISTIIDCWQFKGKNICSTEDLPKKYQNNEQVHIIYKISIGDKYYIGKKILMNKVKKKISKKERLEANTKKVFKYEYKSSNWLQYTGSSKDIEFLSLLKSSKNIKREILMFVEGKYLAAFYEAKYLFADEGMLHPNCLNKNILSRFFKTKINQ